MSKPKKEIDLATRIGIILGILAIIAAILIPIQKAARYMEKQKDDKAKEQTKIREDESVFPEKKLQFALVLSEGKTGYLAENQKKICEVPLFLEKGQAYVPGDVLSDWKNAAIVQADEVWYIQNQGDITAMMEAYNIFLTNQSPVVMEACPVVKQGILSIPLQAAGTIFKTKVQAEESYGLFVLGATDYLTDEEWDALAKELNVQKEKTQDETWMERWAGFGLSKAELKAYAKAGYLYQSDENGKLSKLHLDDEGVLSEADCPDTGECYEADRCLANGIIKEPGLAGQLLNEKTEISGKIPEQVYEEKIQEAIGRFMREKAVWCLMSDEQAKENMQICKTAWEGDFTNDSYLLYQKENPKEIMWEEFDEKDCTFEKLLEVAEPGDFLVFKGRGADVKYGFFNHSALILEKDNEGLHLLHARSAELGVGSEKEMDVITKQSFTEEDYWMDYETVFLCGSAFSIDEKREALTEKAQKRFQDCAFGYGSWLGKEETNCAELIQDAYADVDVPLVKEEPVSSRLKQVLSGDARNMVVVPDDLLFSDSVVIKAVYRAGGTS